MPQKFNSFEEFYAAVRSLPENDYMSDDMVRDSYKYHYGGEIEELPEQNTSYLGDVVDALQSGAIGSVADIAQGVTLGSNNVVSDYLRDWSEDQYKTMRPESVQAMQETGFNDDFSIKDTSSLGGAGLLAAAGLGSLPAFVLPGSAAAKGFSMATKLAPWAAKAAGYGVTGGALMGGGGSNMAYEEAINADPQLLADSKGFQDIYWALKDEEPDASHDALFEQAREQFASEIGEAAFLPNAAVGVASMGISGPLLEKVLRGAAASGRVANAGVGALTEGVQEFTESGGQRYFANQAAIDSYNPQLDPYKGVIGEGLTGSVIGAGIGGTLGAITGKKRDERTEEEVVIDEIKETLATQRAERQAAQVDAEVDAAVQEAVQDTVNKGGDALDAEITSSSVKTQLDPIVAQAHGTVEDNKKRLAETIARRQKQLKVDIDSQADALDQAMGGMVFDSGSLNLPANKEVKQSKTTDLATDTDNQLSPVKDTDNATETSLKDAFKPTHELSTGEQVTATEEPNVYVGADGIEVEDNYATPIKPEPQGVQTNEENAKKDAEATNENDSKVSQQDAAQTIEKSSGDSPISGEAALEQSTSDAQPSLKKTDFLKDERASQDDLSADIPSKGTALVDLSGKIKKAYYHGYSNARGKFEHHIEYIFNSGGKKRSDILYLSNEEFSDRFYIASNKKHASDIKDKLQSELAIGGRDNNESRMIADSLKDEKGSVSEATYPKPQTQEELAKLNEGDIYTATDKEGNTTYLIRSDSPRGTGDTIHRSEEEAVKQASLNKKQKESRERSLKEAEQREQVEAQDKEKQDDIDGFLDDSKPMVRGRAVKSLNKQVRYNGNVATLKSHVKKLVEDGAELSIEEVDKIKPMSRAAFNRATSEQQQAHEEKIKKGGKKKVYYIGDVDLGKTAYDYAAHLQSISGASKSDKGGNVAQNKKETAQGEEKPLNTPKTKTQTKQPEADSEEGASFSNTDDVGGEMSFNRRQRGYTRADIDAAENETTKVQMAVKSKLWARPDYQEMVDEGIQPAIAHIIKQLYDTIPTKPSVSGEKYLNAYVDVVTDMKDAVDAFLSDPKAISRMVGDIAERASKYNRAMGSKSISVAELGSGVSNNEGGLDYFIDAIFPKNDMGYRWGSRNKLGNDRAIATGNRFYKEIGLGLSNFTKAMKAIKEDGFPAKMEAWQRSYRIKEKGDKFEVVKKNRYSATSTHDTREEAVNAARDLVKREKVDKFKEPETPVQKSVREGRELRDGKNVSTKDLQELTGLNKINFGNWMSKPANAKERQAHVNSTYDAFIDLAEILDVPVKALSLNGKLSVAIGAQGKGGAAAHFVPGLNEINLTRTSGAGSLAHEFAHGLDHYFGVLDGLDGKKEPFLSHSSQRRYGKNKSEVRPEIVKAFAEIMRVMKSKNESLADAKKRIKEEYNTSKERLSNFVNAQDLTNKLTGDAKKSLNNILEGKESEYVAWPPAKKRGRKPEGYTYNDVKVIADALGWSFSKAGYLNERAASFFYNAESVKSEPKLRLLHTRFYKAASQLDGNKKKPYWQTPHELFARAFEIYVANKLDERASRNDYLTSRWKLSEDLETDTGKQATLRYPQGEERAVINKAFDTLFAEIKTKETDKGVALYSKSDNVVIDGKVNALSKSQATTELRKDKRLAKAMDKGLLEVVNSESDIPMGAELFMSSSEIQGATLNGKAYVVAEGNTKDTVNSTAWHELTHAAMSDSDFISSEQRSKLLKRLSNQRRLNKNNKFWQDVEQRVKDADTAPEHVLDEIAGYAVTEYLNGNKNLPTGLVKWVKDLIAAIKAVIFKHTGIQFGKVSPQDLMAMTQSYVDFATKGERKVHGGTGDTVLNSIMTKFNTFFSGMGEAIDSKVGKSVNAKMLATQLQNPKLRGKWGIKEEEVEWTGIVEWLQEQDGKVTKQEIQDFIEANQVQVEEVEIGSPSEGDIQALMEDELGENFSREEAIEYLKNDEGQAKYGDYTVKGEAENYRELLLTMPNKLPSNLEVRKWEDGFYVEDKNEEYGQAFSFGRTEEAAKDDYFRQQGISKYTSSHFDEKNILAHIRFDERIDADGNKVLFINEVQSDWHQEGRKRGYNNKGKGGAVPNAPFKGNAWIMLAMKRMIRHAAENGFDKVAWATGEQSAELYSLDKTLSVITYQKGIAGPDLYSVSAKDLSGRVVVLEMGKPIERIAEVLGKEMAEKIANGEGVKSKGGKDIKGDGLKVGGEGMRGFYDKTLPALVNKYIKKWGAKVGEVKMDETQHGFDVTDAMRESAMRGQPLFSRESETAQAHKVAQRNAALPVSEGGLGLPADNTAMDRAKAMGFDVDTTWYHGTGNDFDSFKTDLGGVYFTDSSGYADRYTTRNGEEGRNIIPAYLKLESTFDTRNARHRKIYEDKFIGKWGNGTPLREDGLPDWVESLDFQEFFEGEGLAFDSAIVGEPPTTMRDGSFKPESSLLVMRGEQIRSINAAFDPMKKDRPEILFSKKGKVNKAKKAVKEKIPDFIRDSELADDVADGFSKVWGKVKRQALGALTLGQLGDAASKVLPMINREYMPLYRKMNVERNLWRERGGEIAKRRRDLGKEVSNRLSAIQHESTIEGVNPAEETFTSKIDRDEAMDRLKSLAILKKSNTGDGKKVQQWTEEEKQIRGDLKREIKRKSVYPKLRKMYKALPKEAQDIFNDELKYHRDHYIARHNLLVKRLEESGLSKEATRETMEKLKAMRERTLKHGVYFPLSRFGDYWLKSVDKDGELYFDMFESKRALERHIRTIEEDGYKVTGQGKFIDKERAVDGVSSSFLLAVDEMIKEKGKSKVIDKIRDELYQIYLESLPESSAQKHFVHRSNRRGFNEDQMKAFSNKVVHDSNSIAKLKYAHLMQDVLNKAEESVEASSSNSGIKNAERKLDWLVEFADNQLYNLNKSEIREKINSIKEGAEERKKWMQYKSWAERMSEEQVDKAVSRQKAVVHSMRQIKGSEANEFASNAVSELKASHQAIMEANTHPLAAALNTLGFAWFLGLSPASAIVNLTQTPMVALPVMGSKFGWKSASKEMKDATKDFFAGGERTIKNKLRNKNEEEAYKRWHDEGLLDETISHDLSGYADAGIDSGAFKHKMMGYISYMFHHAEVANREITAIGSYRAAIEAGQSHEQAMKTAEDITWKSHLDYGSGNRARFMRGNWARVLTQFKAYSQGMTHLYVDTFIKAFGNSTAEEKTEAKRALMGLLSMQFAITGAMGMPIAGMLMGTAQALNDAFGDDDEPTDVEADLRQWVKDNTSESFSRFVFKGVADAYTPLSIHGRLSLSDLWLRTSDRDLKGVAHQYDIAQALLGPLFSIAMSPVKFIDYLKDGHYDRALESMLPKVFRDVSKGVKYASDDYKTRSGYDIKEANVGEVIGQMFGFASSDMSDIWDKQTAIRNIDKKLDERRKRLIDNMANAEDGREKLKARQEIRAWNKKHPRARITAKTLRQSNSGKERRARQLNEGMYRSKRNREIWEGYDY
jgi:hypothetical protein